MHQSQGNCSIGRHLPIRTSALFKGTRLYLRLEWNNLQTIAYLYLTVGGLSTVRGKAGPVFAAAEARSRRLGVPQTNPNKLREFLQEQECNGRASEIIANRVTQGERKG